MAVTVHKLRLGFEDLLADELRVVPFEIGPGVESVEVHLAYDRTSATIDLGCEGAAGWRGWSGGARDRFVIGRVAATPGYLPGEPEPGEWRVQLGLYKLPIEPIDVTVEISTPAASAIEVDAEAEPRPDTPRASQRRLPAPDGLTWFAGDFHSHSTHSDGEQSLSELAGLAVSNGLDFLAVTEHNTTSHFAHLAGVGERHGITLLPGQEVTTRRGHANAFGDIGFIDFRRPADEWVRTVAERGGVLSINHALQESLAWQHRLRVMPAAVELWHVTWFREPDATAPWAYLAQWPEPPTLLGGSDYHHPRHGYKPGTPVTWVAAEECTTESIMEAVRAGRTAITRLPTPDAPALVRVGDELVASAADGTVFRDIDGRSRLLHGDHLVIPDTGHGPYRLEATDGAILAIC
ncbi:CehA/McbA family metallohydrolase [Propionibacteriaceae bacterium Y2011]